MSTAGEHCETCASLGRVIVPEGAVVACALHPPTLSDKNGRFNWAPCFVCPPTGCLGHDIPAPAGPISIPSCWPASLPQPPATCTGPDDPTGHDFDEGPGCLYCARCGKTIAFATCEGPDAPTGHAFEVAAHVVVATHWCRRCGGTRSSMPPRNT